MSQYHRMFEHMHVSGADDWIRLHELLAEVRSDLPPSSYRPIIRKSGTQQRSEVMDASYLDSFRPVSAEVCAAFGDRFLDGSWTDGLTEVHLYWIGVILVCVQKTVWAISPTPHNSLTPTIIAFPPFEIKEVALWFCIEWWSDKGFQAFVIEATRNNEET